MFNKSKLVASITLATILILNSSISWGSRYKNRRYTKPLHTSEITAAPLPLTSKIPPVVAELLAEGKVSLAAQRLHSETMSTRNSYLFYEMQKVGQNSAGLEVVADDKAAHFKQLGIAYHNLHLFIKSFGKENRKFISKAKSLYSKAQRKLPKEDRSEVELLRAALDMSTGRTKSAERRFNKRVDQDEVVTTFDGCAALASYYAASNDPKKTVSALRKAKELDSAKQLRTWVAISDDFHTMRSTKEFKKLFAEWKKEDEPEPKKKR